MVASALNFEIIVFLIIPPLFILSVFFDKVVMIYIKHKVNYPWIPTMIKDYLYKYIWHFTKYFLRCFYFSNKYHPIWYSCCFNINLVLWISSFSKVYSNVDLHVFCSSPTLQHNDHGCGPTGDSNTFFTFISWCCINSASCQNILLRCFIGTILFFTLFLAVFSYWQCP